MSDVLTIFGTGAHARKVYHYARDSGWRVGAFVDETMVAVSPILGIEVIHADALAPPRAGQWMFVAVGQAQVRRRVMHRLGSMGWDFPVIQHRSAWIAPDATMAAGVLVAAGAIVETAANVGRGAIIDIGALVDHDCVVGAFCHVRPGQIMGPGESITMPVE